jgi:pilus assembly protein Flp/PilA
MRKILCNSKGQGLIEYLIIVAVIAVGSIGIVRLLGTTVKARYTNITNALQGRETAVQLDTPQTQIENRGLDDFFKGAGH